MSNKTFIPAFQCSVGDWRYYIAMMKYGEVARQVTFGHELSKNNELGQLIQRGLSDRTKDITEYLLKSPHHFLGAIVVAAWGGEPQYTSMKIEDPDGMLSGLDREFGVLTFDGSQQYFALDGQHRLRAIKDAIRIEPGLAHDDICVLLVTHYDTPEGRIKTRRLFSNINRNAVKTAAAEDIVLDEDDGFAILSRRLLDEHEFLKVENRVKVIHRVGDDGLLKLAGNSINTADRNALTTLPVLYDIARYLGWDFPGPVRNPKARPSDEMLVESYIKLDQRLNDLLSSCGDIAKRLTNVTDARDIRGQKPHEKTGHPFMRPVIQKSVARVVSEIVDQGVLSWGEVMKRLKKLDWTIGSAPWLSVFNPSNGKMISAKDNSVLLDEMLHVHLAPSSIQAIKRARKNFKDIRGENYSVSEELLLKGQRGVNPVKNQGRAEPQEELSDQAEAEIINISHAEPDR